jgi:arylsulfatase A-like enzyme
MTRRELLQAAGAAAVGRRPNVLILFSDDQRFDTIAALGNREIRTPNLDRLVARGTAFTHAHIMGGISPAVCVASRAMFWSGQSLFRADERLTAEVTGRGRKGPFTLLPEHFRRHGYSTFGTGKWHNRAPLFARAFSAGGSILMGGGSDHWKVPEHDFRADGVYAAAPDRMATKHSSELFADAAIGFLNQRKPGAEPFLLSVCFTAPHDPRQAPPEVQALYRPEQLRLPKSFRGEHPFDNGELKIRDEMLAPFPRTPEVVREHIADYYAMITHMDAQIGRILDALGRTGEARETIIVFGSDNGLAVGRHGLLGKQNLYDHSVRVPLVLAGPGVARGKRVSSLCYLHDVYPTLCQLTGLPVPETVESRSLLGGAKYESLFFAYRNLQRGVTKGRWKLIRYYAPAAERIQLFDLAKDPDELQDLSAERRYAGRIGQLREEMGRWMQRTEDPLR